MVLLCESKLKFLKSVLDHFEYLKIRLILFFLFLHDILLLKCLFSYTYKNYKDIIVININKKIEIIQEY